MPVAKSDKQAEKLIRDVGHFLALGVDPAKYIADLFDVLPVLVSVMDEQGKVIVASPQHLRLSGVPSSLKSINTVAELFPAYVAERFDLPLPQAIIKRSIDRWDLSVQHKDGEVYVYDIMHRVVEQKGSDKKLILTVGVDVTSRRRADEQAINEHKSQLSYMSFHDPLTGLANRSLFYDRMHKSLSRAKRSKSNIALMLIDLDRFKNINDSLGHDAGDFFLKHIAQRLADNLRDTDTVARLGGDEFVVVLENIVQAQDIENIASKLLDSLAAPLEIQNHEIACTASIGVSLFPKDGDSIDQLLKHADLAMLRAKTLGNNRAQFYAKAMTDNAVNYLLLENDLRKAIEADDLTLHYQPQVNLRTGKISGVEALVRWQHKDRGMISPGEFIPLAEETGLIEPLGAWVLHHACERFQAWLIQGINFGRIAVNLSPRQFRQDNFERSVVHTLFETRLPPEYLELEITESSAMENAAETVEVLNCLAEAGLSLAIDDFGTGYSSLAYLKRFPINKLKIDRSFINDIDSNDADAAIAKSIIDLAHNMSLRVVAEGVERSSQSRWLIDRSCDEVQGFYYARPMPEEDLMALIEDDKRAIKRDSGIRLLLSQQ